MGLFVPEKHKLPVALLTMCTSTAQLFSSYVMAPEDISVKMKDSMTKRMEITNESKEY